MAGSHAGELSELKIEADPAEVGLDPERLALTDPVSAFIPSFADIRVYAGGSDLKQATVPATEPVRVWHLLTHTSGLTYGSHRVHPVDAMYRAAGYDGGLPPAGADLAQAGRLTATLESGDALGSIQRRRGVNT